MLKVWLTERQRLPGDHLFCSRSGTGLSRFAVGDLVGKYAKLARANDPEWTTKNVTPHTLRHTAAMRLLDSGCDESIIALWLGHETTQTTQLYIHGDLKMKERALARTTPPNTPAGRYRPPDTLLSFLESL